MRNKETIDLDGRSGEDLGGIEGEETIIRIYCLGNIYNQNILHEKKSNFNKMKKINIIKVNEKTIHRKSVDAFSIRKQNRHDKHNYHCIL